MTVFKGYLKMTRKNIGIVLMYFGIFLGIAIIMNAAVQKEDKGGFAARKINVAIVDLDQSELSKQLITYLKEKHSITLAKDDKARLSEELYYQKQSVILQILKGFEENAGKGETGIHLTNSPGSYSGIYLEQQINNFVRNVCTYQAAGYSIREGSQKVMGHKEGKVTLEDLNGNGGEQPAHGGFFQFLPYLFLATFGGVLGKILFLFRKREVKNRLMASSVSLKKQNGEMLLAFFAVGVIMYIACIFCLFLIYNHDIVAEKNIVWYLANGFLNMLVALEIAFLVGVLIKSEMQANTVTTPLSLGICFLCGVFVPLEVMGAQVKMIAKFLPVYWYETVNILLMEHENISSAVGRQVLSGMGIQILFVFALAGIGMAIVKYQQQER